MDRRQFLTGLVSGAAAAVLGVKPDLSPLPSPSYHKYWPVSPPIPHGNAHDWGATGVFFESRQGAFYTRDFGAEWMPLETPSPIKIGAFETEHVTLDADEREYLAALAEDCKVSLSIVERPEDMPTGVSVEDAWQAYAKALTEQVNG